jgi:predicted GNAT superfamily acetyltransferase
MSDNFTSISEADVEAVLALNNRYAAEMSWLTPDRLPQLLKSAYQARVTPDGTAFLLAFASDADYDSANFLWFRDRFSRFVYIDRVAVALAARGKGFARQLYEELFERAASDGYGMICCEVNVDPPNPASDAFHARIGFCEVGRATLDAGKMVRYLVKNLPV